MSRVILVVALLVVLCLPALAQPPGGGAPAGPGAERGGDGRGGMMMDRMGGMMSAPPVMTVADGKLYVIFMGQLSAYDAATLELIKTVALPMPQMMGRRPGAGGPPAAAGGGGVPPAAPQ